MVNIYRFNLHKQRLFGLLHNFEECKEILRPKCLKMDNLVRPVTWLKSTFGSIPENGRLSSAPPPSGIGSLLVCQWSHPIYWPEIRILITFPPWSHFQPQQSCKMSFRYLRPFEGGHLAPQLFSLVF